MKIDNLYTIIGMAICAMFLIGVSNAYTHEIKTETHQENTRKLIEKLENNEEEEYEEEPQEIWENTNSRLKSYPNYTSIMQLDKKEGIEKCD